ncbi:MAG TPA: copper resistance CopC family protein [Actinomycetota bacterium]|nr:copper resistance CopC family protein [Actinomycetota bacterium]
MDKMKLWMLLAGTTVMLLAAAAPARAHAERISEEPKAGSTVGSPPGHLYVNFTEPPTGDSTATVIDGCGNDVVGDIELTNKTMHLTLSEGQPGRWEVETRVISGLDGHPTNDGFGFRVKGEADCSAATSDDDSDDADASGTEDDDGSSAPVLLIAIGAVVVVGGAAAVRILGNR